jgi:hypothetical protein
MFCTPGEEEGAPLGEAIFRLSFGSPKGTKEQLSGVVFSSRAGGEAPPTPSAV